MDINRKKHINVKALAAAFNLLKDVSFMSKF